MTSNARLSTELKHLIGVSSAIAAGCHPCTTAFADDAKATGACDRELAFALKHGLIARDTANDFAKQFAATAFEHPKLDAEFLGERQMQGALMDVAAALASNTAVTVKRLVARAKERGASEQQLRIVGDIARTARRGAEREADAAFAESLGIPAPPRCCGETRSSAQSGCPSCTT